MAGIYLHIPFCKQACYYCDFHFSTSTRYKTELIDAMKQEIAMQKQYLEKERIDTIYFGGGTPSLLQADEIRYLIDEIQRYHELAPNAEITLEANPDDLNASKIKELRQTPVNRLSIGIQSFFDEDLKWMNRAHDSKEAEFSVKAAQDSGLENITVDLIYGYPLLSDKKWQENMQQVFLLKVPHVSAYSMTVEPKTALASFIHQGKQVAMDEAQSARQFLALMENMEVQGFEQYEISNFCLPEHYSKHNSNYWKGVKYLGIGPSAHSFNGETRQWNIANNQMYLKSITAKELPAEKEVLTKKDQVNEYIMTSLRTVWGLDLKHVAAIHPEVIDEIIENANTFLANDWLTLNQQIFKLTRTGKLYADQIASTLFV